MSVTDTNYQWKDILNVTDTKFCKGGMMDILNKASGLRVELTKCGISDSGTHQGDIGSSISNICKYERDNLLAWVCL